MRSKKHTLASVLLLMAFGAVVGCTGESGPLIDPQTGEPLTEQELRNVKLMTGLSDPTQKELNDAYINMRQGRAAIFGEISSAEVHPNALDAQ